MKSDEVKATEANTKAIEDQTRELKKVAFAINSLNTNVVEALAALRPEKETQDASGV